MREERDQLLAVEASILSFKDDTSIAAAINQSSVCARKNAMTKSPGGLFFSPDDVDVIGTDKHHSENHAGEFHRGESTPSLCLISPSLHSSVCDHAEATPLTDLNGPTSHKFVKLKAQLDFVSADRQEQNWIDVYREAP